jgi:hypothetical protein
VSGDLARPAAPDQPGQLALLLAAGSDGAPAETAAVRLLDLGGTWLARPDFVTGFIRVGDSPITGLPLGIIRWQPAIRALRAGGLPSSAGEAATLRIAASLAADVPVELGQAITSLDRPSLASVTTAVRIAGGWR